MTLNDMLSINIFKYDESLNAIDNAKNLKTFIDLHKSAFEIVYNNDKSHFFGSIEHNQKQLKEFDLKSKFNNCKSVTFIK
jgi:transcriptional accessory protein Tex/SPT6